MTLPFPYSPELLKGKTALVTGGGTGLGRETALALAKAGARVVVASRREEVVASAAKEIGDATGADTHHAIVNIRDVESVQALAERMAERFGQIDILVNNAGGQFPVRARDMKPKGWRAVIDTNLNGTWNMTQAFGDQMLSGDGGTITQIVAVVGRGFPGLAHTAAARAGVIELTHTLAYEWGPRVRVNCVAPGPIVTGGFEAAYQPGVLKGIVEVPLMRPGRPEDAAYAVVYIASPIADFVTGEVLYVAGGQQLYGPNQALFRNQFPERKLDLPEMNED